MVVLTMGPSVRYPSRYPSLAPSAMWMCYSPPAPAATLIGA